MSEKKTEITFAGLMTLATMLISLGIDLIQKNILMYGVILVVVGTVIMIVAAYLFIKGVIRVFMDKVGVRVAVGGIHGQETKHKL